MVPVFFSFTINVHRREKANEGEKVVQKYKLQKLNRERMSVTVQDRRLSHRTRSMETSLLLMAWWTCERVPRMHMSEERSKANERRQRIQAIVCEYVAFFLRARREAIRL